MTKEVKIAFEHIRKFFPEVNAVDFDSNGAWLYYNKETGNAPSFGFEEINQSILEDASDSVIGEQTIYY